MISSAMQLVEEHAGIDLGGRSSNVVETLSDIVVVQDGIRSRYKATLRYFSGHWSSA